jgi:hypothetical protein
MRANRRRIIASSISVSVVCTLRSQRGVRNVGWSTYFAPLYASKIKSVLFERDFSLKFETYLSKQISHFTRVKQSEPNEMSPKLGLSEWHAWGTKLTAGRSEFIAKTMESLLF